MIIAMFVATVACLFFFFYGLRAYRKEYQKFNWSTLEGKSAKVFGAIVMGLSLVLGSILIPVILAGK